VLHRLCHEQVSQYVNGVSAQWFHSSGTVLVTGSDDSHVRVWDVTRSAPLLGSIRGHSAPISCVAISPDDDAIVSGGDDCKLVLYTRGTAKGCLHTLGDEQDNILDGRMRIGLV
jgi:WD40 repeat protein